MKYRQDKIQCSNKSLSIHIPMGTLHMPATDTLQGLSQPTSGHQHKGNRFFVGFLLHFFHIKEESANCRLWNN